MSFNLPVGQLDLGGTVRKLYVRTSGSDTTGDGTLANPWRTVAFAFTQVPAAYTNGAYVIDCFGITETLTKRPPTPTGAPLSIVVDSSLISGSISNSLLCLHSDLVLSQTIAGANITSVTTNATTGMKTAVTNLALVVNALVGKMVRIAGTIVGVVSANTVTDISISSTSGSVSAGVAIDLCDPGATLIGFEYGFVMAGLYVAGIAFQRSGGVGTYSLRSQLNGGNVTFFACVINDFSLRGKYQVVFSSCYFLGAGTDSVVDGFYNFTRCVFQSMTWGFGVFMFQYQVTFILSIFRACQPLGNVGTGVTMLPTGVLALQQLEFVAPASSAVYMQGSGVCSALMLLINNSVATPLRFDGPIKVKLTTIPAGTANAGVGVTLENGANVAAVFASVAITGAGGDVKIGGLAATTWVLTNAAPGNRLTDTGANGDNSTAKAA